MDGQHKVDIAAGATEGQRMPIRSILQSALSAHCRRPLRVAAPQPEVDIGFQYLGRVVDILCKRKADVLRTMEADNQISSEFGFVRRRRKLVSKMIYQFKAPIRGSVYEC